MKKSKSIKIEMDNGIPKLYMNDVQVDVSNYTEMDIHVHLSPYDSTIKIDSISKHFFDDNE